LARLFDDASSQYLYYNGAVVSAVPFTMACWVYSDDLTIKQQPICLNIQDAGPYAGFWLQLDGSYAGDPVVARAFHGTSGDARTTTGYSANTWHHACAVFSATNARAAYIDGGSKGVNSATVTPIVNNTTIGAEYGWSGTENVVFTPTSGKIAEVGIWNVALTDAEVAILAKGVSPRSVRPESLVFYAPLWRDEDEDFIGGLSLTAVNAPTIADHPRVFYLATPQIGKTAAAGGGVISEIATVSWANVGQFAGIAEASIAQIAGVIAN